MDREPRNAVTPARSDAGIGSALPLLLLTSQRAKEVTVARLGGQRGRARQTLAGVAAAPLQLVAAAFVETDPGGPLPDAFGPDEIDLHPLVAELDNPNRAGLHDGAADLVRPSSEERRVGM